MHTLEHQCCSSNAKPQAHDMLIVSHETVKPCVFEWLLSSQEDHKFIVTIAAKVHLNHDYI